MMAAGPELTWGALFAVLLAATVCDLRTRRVPAWLSGGGIAAGVLAAAWAGPPALGASLLGAAAGGLVFLPFVWRGWLGGADALLLAAVGAWQGWRLALWAAWWTALAGAALALAVWAWRAHRARRGARTPVASAGADRVDGAGLLAPAPPGPASWRAEPFPYVPAVLAGAALALLTGA
jgi:Flp pilus assembly protein protease CpaA